MECNNFLHYIIFFVNPLLSCALAASSLYHRLVNKCIEELGGKRERNSFLSSVETRSTGAYRTPTVELVNNVRSRSIQLQADDQDGKRYRGNGIF